MDFWVADCEHNGPNGHNRQDGHNGQDGHFFICLKGKDEITQGNRPVMRRSNLSPRQKFISIFLIRGRGRPRDVARSSRCAVYFLINQFFAIIKNNHPALWAPFLKKGGEILEIYNFNL